MASDQHDLATQEGGAMTECECDPGTDANGWHETRCAECREVDLDGWRLIDSILDWMMKEEA